MENIKGLLYGPSLVMISVHNRGEYFDPPTEHLGKTIEVEDNSLIGVASLGLTYLTSLVADAEMLI